MTTTEAKQLSLSQQAARWQVLLLDDPEDDALRTEFENWCAADPRHVEAWADIADLHDQLGQLPHPTRYIARRDHVVAFAPRRSWRGWAIAASVALALAFGPNLRRQFLADYTTARAELRQITLEDGSIVHLGADSAIALAFTPSTRAVKLLEGEAFFEVSHKPQRPFEVHSGDITTRVLGTAFMVRHAGDSTAVQVQSGQVAVEDDTRIALEAGDWLRISSDAGLEQGHGAPEQATAFRQHRMVAQNRPLGDALNELQRHFSGKIVVMSPGLKQERVTGVYNTTTPLEAARALVQPFGGTVRMASPWVMIISR